MEVIGKTVVGLVLLVVVGFFSGIATVYFWEWFLIPIFPSIPQITIPQAFGLAFLAQRLVPPTTNKDDDEKREWWENMIIAAIQPIAVLFFGWLVHLFV